MAISIGYFADGPWSHKSFELLINDSKVNIKFICVRYDTEDEVLLNYCRKYSIKYYKVENINSKKFIDELEEYDCDIFVSMSFNQIFKKEILSIPKRGVINCHAGMLPYYRGRNVLNWALINGEKEFGITTHFVDEGIDTGDIILQKHFEIESTDDYSTLLRKAYSGCANVLYETIKIFYGNEIVKRTKQSKIHPTGMYCSVRKVGDENINWNQKSEVIHNFIRAITNPGPNARAWLDTNEIRIISSTLIKEYPHYIGIPGAIINIDKEGFIVKTLDSAIKIVKYESEIKISVGKRLKLI